MAGRSGCPPDARPSGQRRVPAGRRGGRRRGPRRAGAWPRRRPVGRRAADRCSAMDQAFKQKWDQATMDGNTVAAAGAWISDRKYSDKLIRVSARTKAIIFWGEFHFVTSYQNALRRQAAWQQALDEILKKVDFIALPTLQKLPPTLSIVALFERQMLDLQNTVAVNFAGNPACPQGGINLFLTIVAILIPITDQS
jgi:hypothetical protein